LYVAGPPGTFRGRSCKIHTAPSTVARQIAPARVAITAPGSPRNSSSAHAPCRKYSAPNTASSTPGWESPLRSFRSTVAVSSAAQSMRRSAWVISRRRVPVTSGRE
jgi:hypothetical protein